MAYTASALIKIAEAEIGYHEKASNANLDSKTANSGKGNYTKYSRDLHKAGYYNGNKQGFDWCDQFVDWCFYQLCGKNKDKAEYLECQTGNLGAGCGAINIDRVTGAVSITASATVPSVLYNVTRNLTNCASSNTADTAAEGAAYTTTLSPTGTFKKLGAITVTMGGVDISASAVSGSTITIASVTGNIVITCAAVITNIIDTVGISAGMRLSTGDGSNKAKVGWATIGANKDATSLIHLVSGDTLRIKGMTLPAAQTSGSAAVRYSETAEFISSDYIYNGRHWSQIDFASSGDIVTVTAKSNSYIRISLACTDTSAVIATINEPLDA